MAPTPDKSPDNNSKELGDKFKEILKSNGIHDPVSQVILDDAGLRGEGFLSLTKLVKVEFEDKDKQPLNLFVKVQTDNKSYTEMLDEMKAFEKEARFLIDYLGAAREMCKLKGQPDFIDFYPKCYYADGEMIVLENLVVDKGYQTKNKEEGQNLDDAKFALKTLAKHHALGHVMIQENDGPKKFFERFPDLDYETYDKPIQVSLMEDSITSSIQSTLKILEKYDVTGAKETGKMLTDCLDGKAMAMFTNALKISDNSLLVLGHGDYWNNNMMFLVDAHTKKILHHVAIDFQLIHYNSPSIDLGYYFFTSVQPHVRRSHLLELLTLYKDTLNEVTQDFGYPTNLTIDQIFGDFRKKLGFGFWLGFVMSIGPGMALCKDVDISKMDAKDWPILMEQLISKWIEENPEKGKETAKELVELMREYKQLKV